MSITTIYAGPGSGKSFTITNGFRLLTRQNNVRIDPTDEQEQVFSYIKSEYRPDYSCCFFAHNNSTKDNLIQKLPPKTPVYTFNGAGASAIIRNERYQRLNSSRTEEIISEITGHYLRDMEVQDKIYWYAIKKYVHYCKLEDMQVNEESFNYIRFKYPDMSVAIFPDDWEYKASTLLSKSAVLNGSVEFVDMLWMGANLTRKAVYDLGFVDECQDISRISYKLVTRLCRHVVFVGDINQAINAFAGGSEEIYKHIMKVSDAIIPLKMTLRNPPYIVDMANHLRPGGVIKGPNPGPGEHETISYSTLPGKVKGCKPFDTLLISRTNAAVLSCALLLHKHKIPCQIIDKDLADEVKFFFKGFLTKDVTKLRAKIRDYENKNSQSKNKFWVELVKDKCAVCYTLLDEVHSFPELMKLIEITFETRKDGYKLCSIHKSKGLEARNIFILNPPIELAVAMEHPIAREQEINLHFVALTRSAMNLYWVK